MRPSSTRPLDKFFSINALVVSASGTGLNVKDSLHWQVNRGSNELLPHGSSTELMGGVRQGGNNSFGPRFSKACDCCANAHAANESRLLSAEAVTSRKLCCMLVFIGMRIKCTLSLGGGSRGPGGLFHFPLPILKSSLMVQIGVRPLPLQLFC